MDLRGFYIRRIFRILPLYYSMLLAYVVISLLPGLGHKWEALTRAKWYFLFFMNEYIPVEYGHVFGQSWTLGIEEKFYLVWPFCGFVLARRLGWRVAIAVGLAGLTLVSKQFFDPYHALLAGCVLALVLDRGREWRVTALAARVPWVVVAGFAVGAYLAVCWQVSGGVPLFSYAMVLMVAHLALVESPLKRVLSGAWLVKIGKLSYSIYLVHVLVVNAVGKVIPADHWPGWFAGLAVNLGVSALIAEGMYRGIEEPMRRRGRALVDRLRRRSEARAEATVAC